MMGSDRNGSGGRGPAPWREPEPLSRAEMDDIDAMYARLGGTHYDLLGVTSTADRPAVRAAYFELMKRYHPDVYWERDLELYRPRVEAIFRELTVAFETLCDSRRRAEYDAALAARNAPPRPAAAPVSPPKTTGILRKPTTPPTGGSVPPRESGETPSARPPERPASASPGARPSEAPARRASDVPPGVDERVPRDITLQSLLRARGGHIAKQQRERVADLEERVQQAQMRNDVPEVIGLLREAVTLSPDDATLEQRLAQAEAEQAAVLVERLRNAARVHEKDRRWDAAVEAWIRASNERPSDLALLLAVVHASCEGHVDLPRAAEYARRATQLDPRCADAFALQARVFFLAGRMASARGAVDNALRIDPKHPAALDLASRIKAR